MLQHTQFFKRSILAFLVLASSTLVSLHTHADEWRVTEAGTLLIISYGSGTNFPQYAVLHRESSYFRLISGPDAGWGTSVVLFPSFWEGGKLYQGAPVSAASSFEGEDCILSLTGTISSLSLHVQVRLSPPVQDAITADVTVTVNGDVMLDVRPGEAFKPMMLSSMRISPDEWDTQFAYVDSQEFLLPADGWVLNPSVRGMRFGLQGGTSTWKTNAPTVEIVLDENRPITGWVTASADPNDDNIGFWAASDQIMRSYHYTVTSSRPIRTLSFSGQEWIVKSSHMQQVGPGPNYFSDSLDNVWVDGEGKLHLKITQQNTTWYCAEVISTENSGYGTYRFYTESRIDQLDKYVVLGLFTWDDDPAYAHREIDIECSMWGQDVNENAQFVVQPWNTSGNMRRFDMQLTETSSTHSFAWKPEEIFFQCAYGHYATPPSTHIIESWSYAGPDIPPPGNENARMNLWLFQGVSPSDGQEVEVIISAFAFVEHSQNSFLLWTR